MDNLSITICASSAPFSAARNFLNRALSANERDDLRLSLRPIYHGPAPENSSLSDKQTVDDQVRFYTKVRGLMFFRQTAWRLSQKYATSGTLRILGEYDSASEDFFLAIAPYFPLEITLAYQNPTISDEDKLFFDERDRILGRLNTDQDWKWLNGRLGHYLNCGDSWTAIWLAEFVVNNHATVPSYVCDTLGLAYGLQGRTAEAEQYFRVWEKGDAISGARAKYSLSMLYARHHPMALRHDDYALDLLNQAWDVLEHEEEQSPMVVYEGVFNRNGAALIHYRRKNYDIASGLLEEGIEKLKKTQYHSTVHHTVLTNNLGRVYSAMGETQKAESALLAATNIDPDFAEYWYDLASLYCDLGRLDEAWQALNEAERCSNVLSAIPSLQGYIANLREDYESAIGAYKKAWSIDPYQPETGIAIMQNLCELSEYRQALSWYNITFALEMSPDLRESLELLKLEVDLNLQEDFSAVDLKQALMALQLKFPDSEVIHDNLLQLGELQPA